MSEPTQFTVGQVHDAVCKSSHSEFDRSGLNMYCLTDALNELLRAELASVRPPAAPKEMSEPTARAVLCQRCEIGIDDDRDGNCGICAKWGEIELLQRVRKNHRAEIASVRDEAKAAVAAAYEAAANEIKPKCGDPACGIAWHRNEWELVAKIRALITPDHRAALDSLLAEAVAAERDKWTTLYHDASGVQLDFASIIQKAVEESHANDAGLLAKAKLEEAEEWAAHRPGDGFYDRRLAVLRSAAEGK